MSLLSLYNFYPENNKSIQYNIAIILGLFGLFSLLLLLYPTRVGDGSEYYAMYFAWKDTFRPFMTESSWSGVGHLADSGSIRYFVPLEFLKNAFPALKLGSTADFNHFWFYSFLAALISNFFSLLGIKLSPHLSFLILHMTMFSLPCILARRYFGWQGLLAVLILTFFSPILWFIDKVHTEFFTYCLSLSAVIFFLRHKYITATFFLSIASTQNISFGLVALFVLLIDMSIRKEKSYSRSEVILIILTVIFIMLHPAYYYFRFGVITPQLVAGGAKVGSNFQRFYIWLVDPDVGLLPNWPLGFILLFYGLINFRKSKTRLNWAWFIFLVVYLAINLFANSSSENLNHGATPSVSRYALWYIALFFPLILSTLNWRPNNSIFSVIFILLLIFSILFNFNFYGPQLSEAGYTIPTPFSRVIQKYFPFIYDPPAEIFFERFSGLGESPEIYKTLAVVGPDCRKVLLFGQPSNERVINSKGCIYDDEKLFKLLKEKVLSLKPQDTEYVRLNDSEVEKIRFHLENDVWYLLNVNASTSVQAWLASGWSQPEDWGVWSVGHRAELHLPCPDNALVSQDCFTVELQMIGFAVSQHPTTKISIKVGGSTLRSEKITALKNILLDIPIQECGAGFFELVFKIDNPMSPKKLGISADSRKLGIGLISIRFIRRD